MSHVIYTEVTRAARKGGSVWDYVKEAVILIRLDYGVATISRLLKIIGLFCKRAL